MPTLDDVLSAAPERTDLVVDGPRRLSSAGVEASTALLAGWLRARGVDRGDAVAWQLPTCSLAVLLFRACWRIGAVAVALHPRSGTADVETALAQVHPVLVVSSPDLPAAELAAAMVTEPASGPDGLVGGDTPAALTAGSVPVAPRDLACVLFTAGSTGGPKGVRHTHGGLTGKALSMREVHGLGPDDAVLMPAPLAHISGLLNGILVPGAAGMKSVLMARWNPEEALALIAEEGVTFMVGPPTFFVEVMAAEGFSPERVASLRLVSSGGAGVTPAFVASAAETLGAMVKRTYGSTEAPTVTTSYVGDDPDRARETDGRAVPGVELRVADPGSGEERPPGEVGEVWVRGPEVCAGYLDPDQTARAFTDDGWFRTGDLGVLDPDGWLTITGRLKDVIIRKGENISASEVEAVLEAHPAVRQAVALGEPDEAVGERVVAVVVASEPFDLDTCRTWFEEQGVARFKTPERVVVVDEIPMLPAGKPDRSALRSHVFGLQH